MEEFIRISSENKQWKKNQFASAKKFYEIVELKEGKIIGKYTKSAVKLEVQCKRVILDK